MKTDISKKLEQYNLTKFEKAVLIEVAKIQRGKVMSYKADSTGNWQAECI